MKYILMMSATKAGVGTYHTWSPKDAEAHMECLRTIVKELTDFGEFVATPERAYAIAGRISAAPGPGGVPTNMAMEVRRLAMPPAHGENSPGQSD